MKNYQDNEYYKKIDKDRLPNHIAIIMDGNGRWAKKKKQPRYFGHYYGAKNVVEIVRTSSNIGIKHLSLYAFSTENWKRPKEEIEKIMDYALEFINTYIDELDQENVKVDVYGEKRGLSSKLINKISYAIDRTKKNTGMRLNICFNYGGRLEILNACKNLARDHKDGKIYDIENLTFEDFESYLYTKESSDVDLLIRPSGELRVSNFLLYQIAYAEFYFANILWPDFSSEELFKAILSYQERDRRFGGLNE